MAFPSRLKSAFRPVAKVARTVTPTSIGVFLSIGAHAVLLTYGPRTNFSFAALSRAAQQADAEETIVPLVTLSPAERDRLPSFAQPRQPPRTTGLSSLALPSGIIDIPTSRAFKSRPIPARPLPAPATSTPLKPIAPLGNALPPSIRPTPFSIPFPTAPLPRTALPQTPTVAVIPDPPPPPFNPPAVDTFPTDPFNPNIPVLPGGVVLPPDNFSDALAGTEQASVATNPPPANVADPDKPKPVKPSTEDTEEPAAVTIPVEPQVIATAPAQGNPRLLTASNVYDNREVSEEEAKEKTQEWLVATAQGKGTVATRNAEITIDSGFKACRDISPKNGRIGVVVNPDGSQEDITVLKSIGYDVLNRLALSTLDYYDFEQPQVPTQYQVDVKVEYEPEGCVEELPDAPSELPQIGN